jgi:putative adenylate-forming enzyme
MGLKLKIAIWFIRLRLGRLVYHKNPRHLQERRFRKLVRHLSRAPFYQPFLKPGIRITDFPVINKKIFVEQFDRINTRGIRSDEAFETAMKAEDSRDFLPMVRGLTVGLSTGTSGNRAIFIASEDDRARWVAAVLDRVTGISLKKRKVAFFLRANSNLYSSVESRLLQFHFFDLLAPLKKNLQKLNLLQPDLLVAQPSMLVEIAKSMEAGSLTLAPKKVISVAEVLSPEDNRYLAKVFKQPVHQVYQCTEGFLAYTCRFATLHFNEDFIRVEKKYIEHGGGRFHPLVTDLLRTAQPVIRYELDDIIVEKESCPCGSKMMGIECIEGRSDDILVFKNPDGEELKIFPDFFRKAIITSSTSISDYVLTQKTSSSLELFVQSDEPGAYEGAVASLQRLIESYGIPGVEIIQAHDRNFRPGTKFRRIRNEQTSKDNRTG